ncbi:MAG: hypothetical protein ABW184_12655 [Sphingobium sp.]
MTVIHGADSGAGDARLFEGAKDGRRVLCARGHHKAEADAYASLLRRPPPAFATLAPDITYYVASLSKCVGAVLRIAYLIAPD